MVHDIHVWLSKDFVWKSHRLGHLRVELIERRFVVFNHSFGLIRIEWGWLYCKSLIASWMLHCFVAWWCTFDWALEVVSTLVLGHFVKPSEINK